MSNAKNKSLISDSSTSSLHHSQHVATSASISRPKSMGNLIPSVAASTSHSQTYSTVNFYNLQNQIVGQNGTGGGGSGSRGGNAKRSGTSECSPSSCSSSKSCSSSSSYENTYCSASSCDCKNRRGNTAMSTNSWRSSISTTTVTSTTALSSSCSGSSFISLSSCSNPSSNSNSVDDFDDEASVANRLRSKRTKYDPSTSSSYNDGSACNDLSSIFSTTDSSISG